MLGQIHQAKQIASHHDLICQPTFFPKKSHKSTNQNTSIISSKRITLNPTLLYSPTQEESNKQHHRSDRQKKHGGISNVTRFCSSSSLCSKRPTSSWLCSLFPLSIQHSLWLWFLLCHPLCTHMVLLR